MAWRFKASKYKNASPLVPKLDMCIRDVNVGSYQTYSNNIAASAAFVAFNWDHVGSSVAVLPIDDHTRKGKTIPLLQAHYDTVTYLDFSPFHDGLLASGSQDCHVKVWHIPEKGLEKSISTPECAFSTKQRRVETVCFHPTADCLLSGTAMGCVYLWDLTKQQEAFLNMEHPDVIQSLSWKQDGRLCATNCKDKMVRVMDPRAASPITLVADSHQGIVDSRVIWLGNQNRVLTTGFDASRLRQVMIRDLRNFNTPERTLFMDSSTGILMPLFDPDTNMLFLAGKGEATITYLAMMDEEPHLIEGVPHTGEQTKGACLVPKRALKVMEGEVNRVLQLTTNAVIPITYKVPRKSYREFHSDLYPDTTGCKTELSAMQWLNGANTTVPKISLDPAKRELGEAPIIILRGPLNELVNNVANTLVRETENVVNSVLPIKEKMKLMEMQAAKDQCELSKKFNEMSSMLEKMRCIDKALDDNGNGTSKLSSFDSEREKTSDTAPPKPLPRTVSGEEAANGACAPIATVLTSTASTVSATVLNDNLPRPAPRPRATAKKPRLGPKPFSHFTGEFSLQKVFNVPVAPGTQTAKKEAAALGAASDMENAEPPANENGNQLTEQPTSEEQEQGGKEGAAAISPIKSADGGEPMEEGQSDYTVAVQLRERTQASVNGQQVPMAERVMMFERYALPESVDKFDGASGEGTESQFQRMDTGRSTLADRRRIFEARSQSVQDEKASPTPLRRRQLTLAPCELKASDDTALIPPPSEMSNNFLRNRSDLSKENMPLATVKRSNSNSSSTESSNAAPVTTGHSNAPNTCSKRTSTVFGRVSKFRHLQGTAGHKSTQIENIRNLSRQVPGECDGFQANAERVAVPIAGTGGKIAVFELRGAGRLPEGVIPTLLSAQMIMDFQWDPFERSRLAVACDDGCVKLWQIPAGGLTESTSEPTATLVAHAEKIHILRYHPLAKDVLLTASSDMTMKLWDMGTMTEQRRMLGHTEQIFAFAWSPCGRFGATVSKNGRIRVYDPRRSEMPVREGTGPVGTRGSRIVWALEGEYLVVTGFDKVSERQIYVYKVTDLNTPMGMVGLDVSPAILMPFYDEDSSTLFATGRGDSTIYCFEITDEAPFICPLSHHRCTTMTQGLSFLGKNQCDVASVEFAKAFRLTKSTVEPLSFTVPRIKSELFQDDLFPETKVLWQPTLTAAAWFEGVNILPSRVSLQPAGMEKLSSIQQTSTPTPQKKNDAVLLQGSVLHKTCVKNSEEQVKNAVSARMPLNTKLEQDGMEGVDEKEWEE